MLMAEPTQDTSGLNWRVPLGAALIVIAVYLAMMLWAENAEFFLSVLLIAPVLLLVSIASLVYALIARNRQERLTLLSTVAALWVTAVAMFLLAGKYDFAIRTAARWLIWAHDYKAEVLAQPRSANGSFQHIEWDSQGIVPAGFTTVYLVFDPSDSLSTAAKNGRPGKFGGIPCAVFDVNQLEKSWYTVRFYTDDDWSHCN
jgi:hypothetical protein